MWVAPIDLISRTRKIGLSWRSTLVASSMVTGLAMTAGAAMAEDPPIKPAAQRSDQIEEITVTAQKRTENVQNVPISVSALDGETLKELGVKSSDEVAEFMSNLQIALPEGKGNQPVIAIRGVGLNDFNS